MIRLGGARSRVTEDTGSAKVPNVTERDGSFASGNFLGREPSLLERLRRAGQRRARLAWLRRMRPPVVELHGFRVALDHAGWSPTMIEVFYRGLYEVDEVEVLRRVLRRGDRVLDIGAAVGLMSMVAAREVGSDKVHAVEANPALIEWARRNFELNELAPTLVHGAVVPDDHVGETAELFIHEHFWSNALFAKGPDARPITVPAWRFSELIREHEPTVLVLDVEGLESKLLIGTDLAPVQVLVVETHARYAGRRAASEIVAHCLGQGLSLDLVDSLGETLVLSRRMS